MRELELELMVIAQTIDEVIKSLSTTPKKSNEYNHLLGKLEAYMDIQNLVMFRLNQLRKES